MIEFKPGDRVIRVGPDVSMHGADMRQGCVYLVDRAEGSGIESSISVIGVAGTWASKYFVHLLESPRITLPPQVPGRTAYIDTREPGWRRGDPNNWSSLKGKFIVLWDNGEPQEVWHHEEPKS